MTLRENSVYVGQPQEYIANWAVSATTKQAITATDATYAQTITRILFFNSDATVNPTIKLYDNDGVNSRQIAEMAIQVPAIGKNVNLLQSAYLAEVNDLEPTIHLAPGHYLEMDMTAVAGTKNTRVTYGTYQDA